MAQLWVNLPAKHKGAPPRYQSISSRDIPVVRLPDGRGDVRVIAGEFGAAAGPARTFTPMHVLDLRLEAGCEADFSVPEGWTAVLVVLAGVVRVQRTMELREADLAWFDRADGSIHATCVDRASALLLAGEPIDEPVVGQGPFVMNTPAEIRQAILDYRSGRMGHLT